MLGAVLLSMIRGYNADIYFNVGLITIIGLSAKNAILIVEFAIEQEAAGKSTLEAVMEAVKLRLRPIIMTSSPSSPAMIPLVIASGAGAAGRRAVGTGVMGGMLSATFLGIFFIPLFYLAVRRWLTRRRPPTPHEKSHSHDVPAPRSRSAARCVSSSSSPPRACSPAAPTSPRRTSARRCRRRETYPAAFPGDVAPGQRATEISLAQFLVDPRLEALVGQALDRNRDLAVAVARIEEARGLYRIQDADRLPTLDASGDVDAHRASAGPGAARTRPRAMRSASPSPASSSISGAACAICPKRRGANISPRARPSAPFACR